MLNRFKLIIVLLLLVYVYFPVYPDLWRAWMDHSNNSHGVLVPLISLYFIWDRRGDLRCALPSSSNWGLLVLIVSLSLYLLALLGGVAVISRSMVVFSLVGIVLYLYGPHVFKILAFPLLFLLFMVPVPQSIIGMVSLPLQTFATKISAGLISACSIPVYREGNILYFVQTQLEVAEACSGIRSIVALSMLSTMFVYLSKQGTLHKTIMLLSAVPVALLANILRVSGTGVLAHFFGDQVAQGFLHEFSGMVVFFFGLTILFIEYRLLNCFFSKLNKSST